MEMRNKCPPLRHMLQIISAQGVRRALMRNANRRILPALRKALLPQIRGVCVPEAARVPAALT